MFHQGSLDFPADVVDHVAELAAEVPVVAGRLPRPPGDPHSVRRRRRRADRDFGASDAALLDVLSGRIAAARAGCRSSCRGRWRPSARAGRTSVGHRGPALPVRPRSPLPPVIRRSTAIPVPHPVHGRLADPTEGQPLRRADRRRTPVAGGHAAARRHPRPAAQPRARAASASSRVACTSYPGDAGRARAVARPAGAAGVRGHLPLGAGLPERRPGRAVGVGLTGFAVPLDGHLRYGEDNEVRVECGRARTPRWYAGAGIHRRWTPGRRPAAAHRPRRRAGRHPGRRPAWPSSRSRPPWRITSAACARSPSSPNCAKDGAVVATDRVPVSVLPGEPAVARQRLTVSAPDSGARTPPPCTRPR